MHRTTMPSPATKQLFCVLFIDGTRASIFTGVECSQTFCMQYIIEHKQIFGHHFMSKLCVCTTPDDIFETFAGDLRIEGNGQLIVDGAFIAHASMRGSGEYNSGEHRFRFKIESYNINQWIFFGIISHKAIMQSNTWAIRSSYGWGGQDSVILNCAIHAGLNGYSCDFELNDTIELYLDCDHHPICLTNQHTKWIYRMNIDLAKCPFPWYFHLNLFYPRDQVRVMCIET